MVRAAPGKSVSYTTNTPRLTARGTRLVHDRFEAVGAPIATSVLANAFVPHIAPLMQHIIQPIKRCCARCRAVAQSELNVAYTSPTFEISTRIPFALTTLVVCMVYR